MVRSLLLVFLTGCSFALLKTPPAKTARAPLSCDSNPALPIADILLGALTLAAAEGLAVLSANVSGCAEGQKNCHPAIAPYVIVGIFAGGPWVGSSIYGFYYGHQCACLKAQQGTN